LDERSRYSRGAEEGRTTSPQAEIEKMIEEEFKALLALAQEIEAKTDEFITGVKRIKALLKSEDRARMIFELEGEIYELKKVDEQARVMELCHKHGGFFHDYRIVSLGRPAK
jgi:hypothetical protein